MSDLHAQIAANLLAVQGRIGEACARSGRDPRDVLLVAVIKSAKWEWVRALLDLDVRHLAESRPQQLVHRAAQLSAEAPHLPVQWHLIGPLQRNKVRPVLPLARLIHSIDSVRLLERVGLIAGELQLRPRVLLEVNVSGEATKHGFAPEQLWAEWGAITSVPHVEVAGLMTMAPESDDREAARPVFRGLHELRDRLRERGPWELSELSMGMSGDFETAVEEGATLVRVGSRLFEGLAGV
jgi:pyridoxal phosphate enzyme (YggS family)